MIVRVLLYASVLFLICGPTFGDDAAAKPQAKPAAKSQSKPTAKPQAKPAAAESKTNKKVPKKLVLLPIEKNIAEFTNQRRKQHGLPPLQIDENLVKSARRHAIWMARNRRLQHTSQAVAENIAMGYSSSQGVVRGWMNSSGHRANILNGGYRRIGTAAYETADGTVYWCQQFLR